MSGITIQPDELRDDRSQVVRENYLNVKQKTFVNLYVSAHLLQVS